MTKIITLLTTLLGTLAANFTQAESFGSTPTYPPPFEVFQAQAQQSENGWIIDVQVLPGFYLYEKDFKPQVTGLSADEPLQWSRPALTQVEDPLRGPVNVMRAQFRTTLSGSNSEIPPGELWLGLQGCADSGFCYPPEKRLLAIISD